MSQSEKKISKNYADASSPDVSDSEESPDESVQQYDDDNASFLATIVDGSSFRYLIEYLNLSSSVGSFIFTKNYITYQEKAQDGIIFNDLVIKNYNLTDYQFESKNDKIVCTLSLADLRNKTKSVAKKEQMVIYRLKDESKNFYIQVKSQEKGDSNNPMTGCMDMISSPIITYDFPVYSRWKKNPNCTVAQTDFNRLFKSIISNKCNLVQFIVYDKALVINGLGSNNKIAISKEYGKKSNKHIEVFLFDKTIIKSLSKINGFSGAAGTIKFYAEPQLNSKNSQNPLKLTVPVGTFGKINIYLSSCSLN